MVRWNNELLGKTTLIILFVVFFVVTGSSQGMVTSAEKRGSSTTAVDVLCARAVATEAVKSLMCGPKGSQKPEVVAPQAPDFDTPTSAGEAAGSFVEALKNIFNSRKNESVDDDDVDVDAADDDAASREAVRVAEAKAEKERAANDRALTERLNKQLETEKFNDAMDAEIAKIDKGDAIEAEMRREELAPLVNEIIAENTIPISTNSGQGNIDYEQIAPSGIEYRSAFDFVPPSNVERTADFLANYGLQISTNKEGFSDDTQPTIGGEITNRVTNWMFNSSFEGIYKNLKNKYVDAVQKQNGGDPSDQLERNVTSTFVEAHPFSGFLPRIVSSGFNIPLALYNQGLEVIRTGLQNLGLASDTVDREGRP